jgi:integrase
MGPPSTHTASASGTAAPSPGQSGGEGAWLAFTGYQSDDIDDSLVVGRALVVLSLSVLPAHRLTTSFHAWRGTRWHPLAREPAKEELFMAYIERRRLASGKTVYRARAKYQGRELTSTHLDRRAAERWSAEADALVRNDVYFEGDGMRRRKLCELIDRYTKTVLPHKANAYNQRLHMKWWRERLGDYKLSAITRSVIAQCRDELLTPKLGKKRGPATVVRYLASLSHLFTVAIGDWEWAESNPVRGVRKPREPRGRDRYLSEEERSRLLAACRQSTSPDLHDVVLLALCTGMRRGEIMTLEWRDIDLTRRVITLRHTKNGSRRSVPLCSPALEAMAERSKVRRLDTALVFPSDRRVGSAGQVVKPRDITKPWETARDRAGLKDFRFHDLRHSAASYMAMSGATTLEIAAILGHRTLQMTQRYSHLHVEHLRSVVQRASNGVTHGPQ